MTKSSKLILLNENKLIQEEKERLRKLRIIQVREISKQNAALVRNAFRTEKDKEIKNLIQKHKSEKHEQNEVQLNEIKYMVQSHIDNIGHGHTMAETYDENGKQEAKLKALAEGQERATMRGQFALTIQREEKQVQENKENAHIIARHSALEQERMRAANIAKLPKPASLIEEELLNKLVDKKAPQKLVTIHDANAFATTRYHMPETFVDKTLDNYNKLDAYKNADDERTRMQVVEIDQQRTGQERLEKARLRGKHALEKEVLTENYNDILNELNVLQKADREKRQKELINIPKEIFLPAWQRDQEKNELQHELERKFERIYADSNLRKENEIPQPMDLRQLEISQSNFGDAELDLTIVEEFVPKPNEPPPPMPQDTHFETNPASNLTVVSQTTSDPKSQQENMALNKLLGKIRKQREDLTAKTKPLSEPVAEPVNQPDDLKSNDSIMWSPRSPAKSTSPVKEESEQQEELHSNSSNSSSFFSQSQIRVETLADRPMNVKEKKIMRGIMMSSHNVSSLHDMESNRFHGRLQPQRARVELPGADDELDSSLVNNQNTATYSVDLSHASRDPMVAGPRELFNKNDMKLAIELKQKQLQKQQQELEKKLKDLEAKEAELKQEAKQTNGGVDSGNDHNYCSDSVDTWQMGTPPTTDRHNEALTAEDLKRVEYQQMILKMMAQPRRPAETGEFSSSSSTGSIDSTAQRIEERKRELLKKFDIPSGDEDSQQHSVLSRKPPQAPHSTTSSQYIQQQQQINSDDKHTVYSVDSGFSSSSTNFSRPLQSSRAASATKQPINLEVERLNTEIMNAGLKSKKMFTEGRQQQQDHLFGLEFFDPQQNLSDVRDMSIEKLFGWPKIKKLDQQLQEDKSRSIYSLATTMGTSKCSDTSYSSNDTLNSDSNGEDELSSRDETDESSQQLIMSLLRNKNDSKQAKPVASIDSKRQFIQEQLEMVRKQKEQLQMQQAKSLHQQTGNVANGGGRRGSGVSVHELSTIKEVDTPKSERNVKLNQSSSNLSNRNLSDLHEMSSSLISVNSSLENVTQLNETNYNTNSNICRSPVKGKLANLANSLKNMSTHSMSDSSMSSTRSTFKQVNANGSMSLLSNSFTSTSTPMSNSGSIDGDHSKLVFVNNAAKRERQHQQLLDSSLFEYSGNSNTMVKQSSRVEYAAMIYDSLSSNGLSITNGTQLIQNTTSLQSTLNESKLRSAIKKNRAFQTEPTPDTTVLEKKMLKQQAPQTSNAKPSSSNKKWFDILATDDESQLDFHNHSEKINSIGSDLIQGPLSSHSSSTLNGCQEDYDLSHSQNKTLKSQESSGRNLTELSIDNYASFTNNSVLIEQHLSQLMNKSQDMDKTLQQYNPPSKPPIWPQKLTKQSNCSVSDEGGCVTSRTNDNSSLSGASYTYSGAESTNATVSSGGLFDRFLKNYTSSSSVQDEPELSFVSYHAATSNPVSPRPINQTTQFHSSADGGTSGLGSQNNLTNTWSTDKSLVDLSLIQFQQKQLLQQFANVSPIENQLVEGKQQLSAKRVDFSAVNNSTHFALEHTAQKESDFHSTKLSGAQTALNSFTFGSSQMKHQNGTLIEQIAEEPGTNFFSSISYLSEINKTGAPPCNDDSLTSFEQHELTQSTPMSQTPKSFVLAEKQQDSTCNAASQSIENHKANFQKFLDNLDHSNLHLLANNLRLDEEEEPSQYHDIEEEDTNDLTIASAEAQ